MGVRAVEGSVRQPLVCSREALQNLIILLYVYLRKVILQRPLHQKGLSPKVTGVVYVQTSNQHPDKSKFEIEATFFAKTLVKYGKGWYNEFAKLIKYCKIGITVFFL